MAELVPISFSTLLKRMYYEYSRNNSIFDLPAKKFYHPNSELNLSVTSCGNPAANPVGPAAGPHTQLAQNIVLSWLAGSRIIELKTVQIKDQIEIARPCIDMATIGYNTEWSQELRLEESAREYVKASMIIDILQHSFDGSGFKFQEPKTSTVNLETIFDVSVGYDLAGIQSPQICNWLKTMKDASILIEELRKEIPDEFEQYRDLPFTTKISESITLSTFHGTPADEIERICEFLLTEMGFHVVVKMNPPMLGKDRLEYLLHERLGYTEVEVNPKAYEVNISFDDAVAMVKRLQNIAAQNKKTIGVKFGNTLEVLNKGSFLKEKVQYLSGQPLHILHLALVNEWRKEFGAGFPISFSAGVDANNFADCVAIGLVPVTVCTDLLRPGGYGRLPQYLLNLEKRMKEVGAKTIDEFIVKTGLRFEVGGLNKTIHTTEPHTTKLESAILQNTTSLFEKSLVNSRYHASNNAKPPRKIGSSLHLFDCINCDKCIPVCPNDANFFFDIEPLEIQYRNVEITKSGWKYVEEGIFKIVEQHQIANFADACNECGNCDVFCPEDGGPYIEKPRFFGSLESFRKWNTLSGFVLLSDKKNTTLFGRFQKKEFELVLDQQQQSVTFKIANALLTIDWKSHNVLDAVIFNSSSLEFFDMRYYFVMATLMKGMLNTNRVHFVNTELQKLTT